jgi:ABC-type multidrug transport system fused ATPase/permease subunit
MVGVIRQVLTIDKVFSKFLIISIIAGVILGIVEIIFFYSLKEALNFFDILEIKKQWEYDFLNPIHLFLFFALLRLFISAFTYFWQIYLGGYFKYLVKKNVISFLYSDNQQLKISLKDTSNFLTNISDRGSFCLHHLSSMLSQSFLVVINLFFFNNYKL